MNFKNFVTVLFAMSVTLLFGGEVTTSYDDNTYAGEDAFNNTSFSANNTAYGRDTFAESTRGKFNVLVGEQTSYRSATNDANVAVGHYAMNFTTNMNNCVAIGYGALSYKAYLTNAVQIGSLIYSDGRSRFSLSPLAYMDDDKKPMVWQDGIVTIGGDYVYVYPTMCANLDWHSTLGRRIESWDEIVGDSWHYKSLQLPFGSVLIYYSQLDTLIDHADIQGIYVTEKSSVFAYGNPSDAIYSDGCYRGVKSGNEVYLTTATTNVNSTATRFRYSFLHTYNGKITMRCDRYEQSGSSWVLKKREFEQTFWGKEDNPVMVKGEVSSLYDIPTSLEPEKASPATTKYVENWTPNIRYEDGALKVYVNGVKVGKVVIEND